MGSLESWLLLRSLRTMHLRIPRQSASATEVAQWLDKAVVPEGQEFDGIPGGMITKVWHSSLQGTDSKGFNPASQMEGGYNATFSILVRPLLIQTIRVCTDLSCQLSKVEYADALPHTLEYFVVSLEMFSKRFLYSFVGSLQLVLEEWSP